ncbi:kelch domain-containing protein 9-like isoform X1 [Biomphalaria glabrata]|uniref:Kelch domain-containing protein 9-like isoform X1 n=2 Tax=Biomphalaria glabrata TaxID=6526 RepID=A0A9U8E0S6_BIOGL|nr:kelch domain-containing protein 9-like isoform X1 [Biomphalaria glabrata]
MAMVSQHRSRSLLTRISNLDLTESNCSSHIGLKFMKQLKLKHTHSSNEFSHKTRVCARSKSLVLQRNCSMSKPVMTVTWEPVAPLGPNAAFHACALVGKTLYFHGGIQDASSSSVPSKQFFKLNLDTLLWEKVAAPGSPALSHHAAVVLENRYFTLIGGWNGKKRLASIYVYDTVENKWMEMTHQGFPSGAGLSSHTATLTTNGKVLVIGREGSLRTQRKHGNMYILSGSVASNQFIYTSYTNNIISRSGHTVNLIGNNLYILGGRSDMLFEKFVGIDYKKNSSCMLLDSIGKEINSSHQQHLEKLPCGRKHHISAATNDFILMHGGETFDGKAHAPVGDLFLITLKPITKFYQLHSSQLCRSGHACIVLPNRIFIHGGRSGKNVINSGLYELKITTS